MLDAGIVPDRYKGDDAAIAFTEDMNRLLTGATVPMTIMFDEIEAITFGVRQNEDLQNLWYDGNNFINFWNTIKAYDEQYPRRISLLIAGTNPMISEMPTIGAEKRDNPMYNRLAFADQGPYLQAFNREDTANMVNTLGGYMGLSFDEYCIGGLQRDSGGHPYLMRIMCSHINKYVRQQGTERPVTIGQATYDHALQEFEKSSEARNFYSMILNILLISYSKEFEMLKMLALQGDETIAQIQTPETMSHLIGYGLVTCEMGRYAIKYDVIKNHLRDKHRYERIGLNVQEQCNEIYERLLLGGEIKLRKLVQLTLRLMLGEDAATELVLQVTDSRAVHRTYEELFDTTASLMYLSTLIRIIESVPHCFVHVFNGYTENEIAKRFLRLNEARKCCAHPPEEYARNWDWSRFQQFREDMTWLEKILDRFIRD